MPAAFLAGLLRSRLARAGLADLFGDLRTLRGADLQEALARAMGDNALVVARRDPRGAGYVDHAGHPVEMPSIAGERRIVPVQRDGREIAALVYDASLDDDPQLVEAVSAAAAIALENEQLHDESRARMAELRASRERLVAAGDDERRRLERNLHDGAQQRLVALSMQLRFLQSRIREDPATPRRSRRSRARSWPSPSASCASSPAASIPRCSTTGSSRRSSRWPHGLRFRPACATR